jgi:hypothetical protein
MSDVQRARNVTGDVSRPLPAATAMFNSTQSQGRAVLKGGYDYFSNQLSREKGTVRRHFNPLGFTLRLRPAGGVASVLKAPRFGASTLPTVLFSSPTITQTVAADKSIPGVLFPGSCRPVH